jgi:hypothetical protein
MRPIVCEESELSQAVGVYEIETWERVWVILALASLRICVVLTGRGGEALTG